MEIPWQRRRRRLDLLMVAAQIWHQTQQNDSFMLTGSQGPWTAPQLSTRSQITVFCRQHPEQIRKIAEQSTNTQGKHGELICLLWASPCMDSRKSDTANQNSPTAQFPSTLLRKTIHHNNGRPSLFPPQSLSLGTYSLFEQD